MKHSRGTRFEDYLTVSTWTVKGLKALGKGTTSIECTPFPHQNSSDWCMVLHNKSDGLHLSFLLAKSGSEKPLRAQLKADEILPAGEKREVFPRAWYYLKQGGKTEMHFIRKPDATKDDDNSEDEITLQCEIGIQCIVQDELAVVDAAEPHASIVRGLGEMLQKEVLTDFGLHAGGTVLKAHRALLSMRSPYFAAMLQPHTKEAREGFVKVWDVNSEVLKQVLLYVYTGVAPALRDMPWDLLIAADKYQLQHLKRQCEAHIASCLSVDNAAETAANASLFSCDILWDRAVLFIKRNLYQVMRTPGWTETISTHPEVIQRISELMA
ncbi:speckle-type POZ protein-like [Schistocerca serialis cubense]|uniref:speckle-type POZ protein-like n=1 Tax=Schistocerca serialis cubense TaxID=2023355 RepID=UPI00214F509E|nr:speckle-type POZ protein-like [Schistocerca serialis cubense]